jgi:hypothetical protein
MSSRHVTGLGPTTLSPPLSVEVRIGANDRAATKRGRRQPQIDDFKAISELPQSVPILHRELHAIEMLLGRELLELLNKR